MELVDLYNKNKEKTGVIKDRNELKVGEFRLCVHTWIIDSKNQFLIQKRAKTKRLFANLWSQTGGGVLSGETSIEAMKREVKEEIGLDVLDNEATLIATYLRESNILDVWAVRKEDIDIDSLVLQKSEVADVKLVTFEEFDKMIEKGIIAPSINPSYTIFKTYINNYELRDLK